MPDTDRDWYLALDLHQQNEMNEWLETLLGLKLLAPEGAVTALKLAKLGL